MLKVPISRQVALSSDRAKSRMVSPTDRQRAGKFSPQRNDGCLKPEFSQQRLAVCLGTPSAVSLTQRTVTRSAAASQRFAAITALLAWWCGFQQITT